MPRPTKEERLAKVHQTALSRFDDVESSSHDERLLSLQDRRFYSISGAQWEGEYSQQFENKPKFEVNKIHLAVIRIINEYRNNRISVDFKSRKGRQCDKFADLCDGAYRADEQDSPAQEAYDNAFEEGTAGGFGAWRLRTEFEDDEDIDNDYQRIRFVPITDADNCVFFDPQSKLYDKSDAKWAFLLSSMTHEAYEEEWNDSISSWPKEIQNRYFDWHTNKIVWVAEYYVVEIKKVNLHIWEMLDGSERRLFPEEVEEERDTLLAIGGKEIRTRQVKQRKIHKYIMSGGKVLEDCGYLAGTQIPIIPFFGKRWVVDNIERFMGHVRLAKDPQRLKNMQLSKLGEISALGSVSKPIMTPEQVAGHELYWKDDNIKNYPYLLINPVVDPDGNETPLPPIGYTKTAEIPDALAALLKLTEEDMQDLLGNQQNGEQLQGNISTETSHLIQNRLDMQTFIYLSNFARSIKRSGEVWLSMAKDIYVEEDREFDLVTEEGDTNSIKLMSPNIDDIGNKVYDNNFSDAKMKVITDVGPSSSTRRMATTRSLIAMLEKTADPETKQVISAMIMMNMEGEGVDDVRQYFRRKLIQLKVIKPTDEEAEELAKEQQNQKQSSQDQYFEAAAAKEISEAAEKQANSLLKQAQVDKTRIETLKTAQELNESEERIFLALLEKLGPRVKAPPDVPGVDVTE